MLSVANVYVDGELSGVYLNYDGPFFRRHVAPKNIMSYILSVSYSD